jgi:hypothetical protein
MPGSLSLRLLAFTKHTEREALPDASIEKALAPSGFPPSFDRSKTPGTLAKHNVLSASGVEKDTRRRWYTSPEKLIEL